MVTGIQQRNSLKNLEDDFVGIIEVLNRHNVEFLVVGGFGAILRGASTATKDIDLVVNTDIKNYNRLANAMKELDAHYRGVEDLDVPWSGVLI